MAIELIAEHRRNLKNETMVSVVFNTVISGLFAWGLFNGTRVIPLWGPRGIVVDLIPTVFMITLVMTLALTLITRSRLNRGKLPAPAWERSDLGFIDWLPRNVMLRALLQAIIATVVLVPLSAGLLILASVDSMSFPAFFVFKLFYGAAIALLVTPPIILRGLADAA